MCGIIGYIGENADNYVKWVEDGLKKLTHRGPDGNNLITSNNYVFGHTRLSIIDLSDNAIQPMCYGDSVFTFNGEIYNYQQLHSYMDANDDKGLNNSQGDTATFLKYIHRYGIHSALNSANGMWAFGLYNKKQERFYASVDRFGQKPFYYFQSGNQLWFASSPNILYNLKIGWDLDRKAVVSYLQLGGIIGPDRMFKGIKKLCANELLTFNPKTGQLIIENYWVPNHNLNTQSIELIVNNAIDMCKVSDVPVNIFMSGGIDSTIVASRFAHHTAIHLKSNEEEYAQDVAKKFHLSLKIANPLHHHINEIMHDYVSKSGEPTMAGAIPWITAKYAKNFGKVAIIANGADELFFGYDRIHRDNENESVSQNNHLFRGSAFSHGELNAYRLKYGSKFSSRWTELMTFVQFDINSTLDFASMAHSLEVRSPFLDHRLVEAALSIEEPIHRKKGNKSILKEMLWKLGFNQAWTDRPKQGFSLFFKPEQTDEMRDRAFEWLLSNNFLILKNKLSSRDENYLKSSALGLYYWYQHYGEFIYANQKNKKTLGS